MAVITNPFIANVPKQLSNEELIQAIRLDILGEMEAIIGYEAHAMATNDQAVKQILSNIADEERRHVGQLQQVLYLLNPKEQQFIENGKQLIIQQQGQNIQPMQ